MSWKDKIQEYLMVKDEFLEKLHGPLSLKVFQANSNQLISQISEVVQEAELVEHLEEEDTTRNQLELIKYRWFTESLDLAILLRDIEIRSSRHAILSEATGQNEESNETIDTEYREIVKNAIQDNTTLLNKILENSLRSDAKWFHQLSPGGEILAQLKQIQEQKILIQESHDVLKELCPELIKHREYVLDYNNQRLKKIRDLEKQLSEIISLINDAPIEISKEALQQLSKSIEKNCISIENEKINLAPYESFTTTIGEYKIPIYSNGGELMYKTISFSKRMESWTENELFPKMYDVDSDISTLYDSALITVYNTRNKLESLALNDQETYVFAADQFNDILVRKHDDISAYIVKLDTVIHEINSLISSEFRVEKIYDQSSQFLEEKGFTNISKLTNQRLWYERNLWSSIKTKFSSYVSSENIPIIERLKQDPYTFVARKQIDAQDLDINSLFLKRGYLGRSFYIPRSNIHEQFTKSFEHWKDGFRGSVLISGRYGSGKSSFLEFIPYYLAGEEVIQLSLFNVIKLNGRKHQVGYNLSETISFLGSQSINSKLIVCIDNLELWKSNDRSMYDSIRDLIEGISKYGKRIFFVVATNHHMLLHINRLFDFESRFANTINVDVMADNAMTEALVVRHNASLKEFDMEEHSIIMKRATKIVKKSRYNIGSAMFAWERFFEYGLMPETAPPSFHRLVDQHKLMLRIMLTNKQIRDKDLRKSMTSLDNNFISEEIRKLTGFKILERTLDGNLRINPFIVDEVENSLQRN